MPSCDPILCKTILNALIFFYEILFSNMGLAIIAVTLLIRFLLAPLLSKSLLNAQKMRELSPKLSKLKKKYKGDQKKFLQAQADLYRENGINPAAGCLPQVVQIVVLIGFFAALSALLRSEQSYLDSLLYPFVSSFGIEKLNTQFLYLDLAQPDTFKIPSIPVPLPGFLLIASVVVQFVSSKMMLPQAEKQQKRAAETKGSLDDVLASSQQQMIYLFPLMTLIIGIGFPSGLVLYWFTLSLFQLGFQDWYSTNSKLRAFLKTSSVLK